MIDTIMLFAAGFGNRMRHLTENSPKNLITVLQKPILHYVLELCTLYDFKQIVINTHYLHDQVEDSIKEFQSTNPNYPKITTIYEEELLETGGAIKNAYKLLGDKPIFAINTDVILKSQTNIFTYMIKNWNPEKMDFLLLMQKFENSIGYSGHGDFDLDSHGKLSREDKETNYDFVYSGLQILKPGKVVIHPLKIFSLREYYLNSDKVRGIPAPDDTRWYHATSPEDLVEIEMDLLAHGDG